MPTTKYSLKYSREYIKDLKKIPKQYQKKIREKIESLAIDPRPYGCKKLQGSTKASLYRVRCGDYRIVYSIDDHVLIVLIIEIGHRRDIYR